MSSLAIGAGGRSSPHLASQPSTVSKGILAVRFTNRRSLVSLYRQGHRKPN